ncbi:MAG: Hsp20/alpha crystallin family protein [Betaproteobacteria bacterium]
MKTPLVTPCRRELMGMSSMFDDFLNDMWGMPEWLPARHGEMPALTRARMDVLDQGDRFMVAVDMPGVKKEDINVSIDGPRVAITAESATETPVKEGEKLLYTERHAASYARSFDLPADVTETGADAVFEDGVLKLTLPKRVATPTKRLEIH